MVSHVDDEDLALIALGETAEAHDDAHLATCVRCQSRLDQLAAVVSSARSVTVDDRPLAPPDSVWASITAELAADQPVTSLDEERRRRRPRLWLIAASAAAVGLLAGAGLAAMITTSTPSNQLVASATLDPIGDAAVTGSAKVEKTADGTSLIVDVPGLASAGDGYYEVWMATPDTTTMVAVGTLRPGQPGTFELPANLDPASFPVVDVSLEHFDGDAGHSATSVVRGNLAT